MGSSFWCASLCPTRAALLSARCTRRRTRCVRNVTLHLLQVGWWLCQAGAAHAQQAMAPAAQLAVHFAWGQASSLVVEAIAASTGMWAYKPEGWNVSLLRLPNGKHLTLLPQLIWALASTAFWAVTLFV